MRRENSEQNIFKGAMPLMREQQLDENQGANELLLQEYVKYPEN